MQMSTFKKIAMQVISTHDHKRFIVSSMVYRGLTLYNDIIQDVKMWAWWRYLHTVPQCNKKVRVLARMLYHQHCLGEVVSMYDKSSPICQLCDDNVIESVEHCLFNCSQFQRLRINLWNKVLQVAPPAMRNELMHMDSKKKTTFILSGFQGEFIPEWGELYDVALQFCYAIYHQRRLM